MLLPKYVTGCWHQCLVTCDISGIPSSDYTLLFVGDRMVERLAFWQVSSVEHDSSVVALVAGFARISEFL